MWRRSTRDLGERHGSWSRAHDDSIYVCDRDRLLCIDASDGATRFEAKLPNVREICAPPLATPAAVLVGSTDGVVLALDRHTGKLGKTMRFGSATPRGSFVHSIAVSGDSCVAKARNAREVKARRLSARTGSWSLAATEPVELAADGDLVVICGEDEIVGVDGSSGAPRWRAPHAHGEAWPSIHDGRVFVRNHPDPYSPRRVLRALDAATGAPCWTFEHDDLHGHVATPHGVIVFTLRNMLALHPATGELRWKVEHARTGSTIFGASLRIIGGVILLRDPVPQAPATVRAFDLTDGQHIFDFTQRGMVGCPMYAGGHLVVTCSDEVIALEVATT